MYQQLAYCTNVHAGSDLDGTWRNLQRHALVVKERFAAHEPMGVGLWLAAQAAQQLRDSPRLAEFSAWLARQQLIPFTLNGFPYGDFHEPVVKHRVYQPTWFDPARRDYTLHLIDILHAILPESVLGSISTLPVAWRSPEPTRDQWQAAARHLLAIAERLQRLEQETGRLVTLCLEPEPGCLLQRAEDVVMFFEDYLFAQGGSECSRYLQVCHDVCHSAVMFEDQRDVLVRYAERGIHVGKVQVSSAIEVEFDRMDRERRDAVCKELSSFAEDRYLHQTTVRTSRDEPVSFFDDLPEALAAARENPRYLDGTWRVHFHVPVFLSEFQGIGTTQHAIRECLEASGLHPQLAHFEVETYAWSVLPPPLRCRELAEGIAREMYWLQKEVRSVKSDV